MDQLTSSTKGGNNNDLILDMTQSSEFLQINRLVPLVADKE